MPAFLWTQKEDIGPSPRYGHAMCYDTARQRTLLFGGANDAPLGDSWAWSGQHWTQVADTGPSPRFDHAMCYDHYSHRALLFGGKSGDQLFSDTWYWDGENWTQVEDSGPSARSGHRMAFDRVRFRAVLFGGRSSAGMMRDTWEWDGQSWTQVEDAGPPARYNHGMHYDYVGRNTMLFGGEGDGGTIFADTWQWDGNNWTQIEDIGPPACTRPALVSTDAQLVLFGGISSSASNPPPTLFDDSWSFGNDQWTQKQDMGPAARWGHAMAFDLDRRTIVMFGGHSSAAFDNIQDLRRDTWEHVETEAAPVDPDNPPPPEGSQPSVIELFFEPVPASSGQMTWAHMTLDQPGDGNTQIQLLWIPASNVDMSDPNNPQFDPAMLQSLAIYTVPPGQTKYSDQFTAPQINGSIVVLATTDGMTAKFAELQII
jgi:hypothetical protein